MAPTDSLQNYQPRSTFSTWLGVVLLFALFGLIAVVILRAAPRGTNYEKKRAENRMKKLEDAQKENLAALTTYAWVDKTKGVARIPITDAMKLTVAELATKKPAAAGPVAAESPAPAAAPGASPAASAPAAASPAPASSASATPKPTSVEGQNSEAHNQPAAAANPPAAPPHTQPGPGSSPAASAPPPAAKAPASPAASASPSVPGTPLPVRGKTP